VRGSQALAQPLGNQSPAIDYLQSAMGIGMKEKIDKYWGLWHTSNDHEMEEKGRAKGKGKEKEKENINCSLQ
jgi:hypothetical protein